MAKPGRPRQSKTGFDKSDVATFIAEGENLAGAYAVARRSGPYSSKYTPDFEYILFISITGIRGYHPLLASAGGEARAFKSFDRILRMLRNELDFKGAITVYDCDDPRRPEEATGATKRRPGDRQPNKCATDE